METQIKQQGKVIGNVGILDLRQATEETVAEIGQIGNVGEVYYTAETAKLLTRLNIGNLGASLEIPADAKLLSGQTVIGPDFFAENEAGSTIVIMGMAVIEAGVSKEDIKPEGSDWIVSGLLLCPEHLSGRLQGKIKELQGVLHVYDPQTKLVVGNLTLDDYYLQGLADNTALLITGRLDAWQVLSNDLLAQKVQRITVLNRLVCREENASVLLGRLDTKRGSPKQTIIPQGYQFVKHALQLEADLLDVLPGQKLYCAKSVQIDENIEPEALDKALETLVIEGVLVCPAGLKAVMAKKCNLLETEAVFYEGELWVIEGEANLVAARFDYLADKATLIVRGELTIAPDVAAKTLAERLEKVHLFGEIFCTADQMAALQARLGLNKGEFIDLSLSQTEAKGTIGNIGVLKL